MIRVLRVKKSRLCTHLLQKATKKIQEESNVVSRPAAVQAND